MQRLFILIGLALFGVSAVLMLNTEEGEMPVAVIFTAALGVVFLIISIIPELYRRFFDRKSADRLEESNFATKKKVAVALYKDFESRGILHFSTDVNESNFDEIMEIAKNNYAITHFSDLRSYYYLGRRTTEKEREWKANKNNPIWRVKHAFKKLKRRFRRRR